MKIKSFYLKTLAAFLAVMMVLTPGMVAIVLAQDAPSATLQAQIASDDEIQTVQQLAKAGYLTVLCR